MKNCPDCMTDENAVGEGVRCAQHEIQRLKDIIAEQSDSRRFAFLNILRMKGVESEENVCQPCGGIGVRIYGSTSTWRGGIGGCAMTNDVCDRCWGSGDKTRPWPAWRREDKLAIAKCEAFDEVRYYLRGIGPRDNPTAGAIDEFCTRKIVTLGGTFDDDRKFCGLKKEVKE